MTAKTLEIKTGLVILKPPHEVFEAVVLFIVYSAYLQSSAQ